MCLARFAFEKIFLIALGRVDCMRVNKQGKMISWIIAAAHHSIVDQDGDEKRRWIDVEAM